MLNNYQNYYVYAQLVQTGQLTIDTRSITKDTWSDYYEALKNIFRDGIETEQVHHMFVHIIFADDVELDLTLFDLFFNLIFWYIVIHSNMEIKSDSLFFSDTITQKDIKKYFDRTIIKVRDKYDIQTLNNVIADTLYRFMDIDEFSFYIANTLNLKDTIDLENACPEFNKLMHTSLRDVPIESVKDEGLKITNRSVEIIKDSEKYLGFDHCLKNSFVSGEGVKIRQYKEFAINIGTKPDGKGGVLPAIIDGSYLDGSLNSILAQYVDSSAARVAQIQSKKNVGTSGDMARILGINNIDTTINQDLTYRCNTKNFLKITLKNKKVFDRFVDRWYRFHPDGLEYYMTANDTQLIGKTLYFRSPITCVSAAHGHGVCAACYGGLSHINYNLKIGKYAAEQLSSQLTQKQLSAKHLLETVITKVEWTPEFYKYFTIDINAIFANPKAEPATIYIDPNNIISNFDNEDATDPSMMDYISYITEFTLVNKKGESFTITSKNNTEMYITNALQQYLNKSATVTDDGLYEINLKDMINSETCLFLITIDNNELAKTLKDIENLINRKDSVAENTKDSIVQKLIDLCIEGKLEIQAVHLEVIIMNQIRSIRSMLRKPDWEVENEDYNLVSLDKALKDNPSVVVSLLYQNLAWMLSYPLTFQKELPSCMDLFFMKQPQNIESDDNAKEERHLINPVIDLDK